MSRALAPVAGLVLAAVALSLPAPAAQPPAAGNADAPYPHPNGYVCYRAEKPPAIDGDLSDVAWAAVPWTEAFVDIEGDKRPKPRFRTRVKMVWDDEALYIVADMEEPHVWGTLKDHDSVIFHDNDFEVFLDPDGDNHLYGELEVNALNTTWDLLLSKPYKDSGNAINAWEILGLKTAVKINGTLNDPSDTDKGWTLEIKWPWKGVGEIVHGGNTPVPPKDGNQWRINFSRVEWDIEIANGKYKKVPKRPEHNWVWSPQGAIDMHRPERWGYLQFSTAKPGDAKFKPDPNWDAREALHRAYYGQLAYHKAHKKFATKLDDLGLKLPADRLKLEPTRTGYELTWADGKRTFSLTSDGRFK
jgi:hypothetical protein